MKRLLIIGAAFAASLSIAGTAHAQTAPTVPDEDAVEEAIDDDDEESDKTGLWGLAGLLGLAGLAGLKRRKETTGGYNTPVTGAAPRTSQGATGSGTTSH